MPVGVLWDVGNVFVRWDPRTLYLKIFEDPAACDRFLDEVCTLEWHSRHDRGLSFADGIAELTARFPEHGQAIAAWKSRWWEMFSGPVDETTACVAALHRRGVLQVGLTNMSEEVWDGVRAINPALELLSDVVISGRERVIKPEPQIYAIACARAGLAPHQLLFVDDSAANIEQAEKLGFDTHLFCDPAALRPALQARGLL